MEIKRLFFGDKLNIGQFIEKNAVLLTFALCMFLTPLSFMKQSFIHPGNIFYLWGLLAVIGIVSAFVLSRFYALKSNVLTVLFVAFMLAGWLWLKGLNAIEHKAIYVFVTMWLGLTVWYAVMVILKKATFKTTILFVFLMSFCLRLCYVLVTDIGTRQHDFYGFGADDGHGGYIKYIYEHGFRLYDGDPTKIDQFYHPPLHYFICAVWWKLLANFGIADAFAQESMQMLTLFYASVCLITFYKILNMFNVKGMPALIAFGVFCFHPTFIIFSGSINNDILSVTFMTVALYLALKWHKEQRLTDIIFCGIAIGLGMMTKLSAYMICVPIAFVFIWHFVKDMLKDRKSAWKKYIKHFGLFLLVCAPLALFWSVRNYVRFDIPFTYVQKLDENSWQYVGNYSFLERVLLLSPKQFTSVYDMWTNRGPKLYNEYNPMISLLKTAMFGEYINDYSNPSIKGFGEVLYISSVALAIISLASMVYSTVTAIRKKENLVFRLTVLISHVFMVLFYYYFCFSFPHHCSMNIRYVSLLIFSGVMFIAFALSDLKKFSTKRTYNICSVVVGIVATLFISFSTLSYVAISV